MSASIATNVQYAAQVQSAVAQMEQDFLLRIKNYHLPPCPKHSLLDEESAQVCLKRECPRYLELSCSECLRLEHLEPVHSTRSFINFKLFLARLLELVNVNRTAREQLSAKLQPYLLSQRNLCQEIIAVAQQISEEATKLLSRTEQYIQNSMTTYRQSFEESEQETRVRTLIGEVLQHFDREQLQKTLVRLRDMIYVSEAGEQQIELLRPGMQETATMAMTSGSTMREGALVSGIIPLEVYEGLSMHELACQKYEQQCGSVLARLSGILEEMRALKYEEKESMRGSSAQAVYPQQQPQQRTMMSGVGIAQQQQSQDLYFAADKRAPSIMIDRMLIAHQTRHEEFKRFALMEPQLSMTVRRRWSLRVHELREWIGVGVGHPSILMAEKYEFDVNSLGHGYYMISHNGFTWSHDNANEQCKQRSFTFGTGDVINIEFDPLARKVRFTKNNLRTIVELTLTASQDDFCGVANLGGDGDCVEILSSAEF